MTVIQPFINLLLFLWLLLLTAWVIRTTWGHKVNHSTVHGNEELLDQVRDSQRLVTVMSEDLLAVTQRVLQELDEIRTRVDELSGDRDTVISSVNPVVNSPSTVQPDDLHPSLKPYQEVYRRAAAGQSVVTIAKELNMGKGEVELVLALGQHPVKERHKS